MCDPYGSASSAAQAAFSAAFIRAKQTEALKFGFKAIVNVICSDLYTRMQTVHVLCTCIYMYHMCVYIVALFHGSPSVIMSGDLCTFTIACVKESLEKS